MAEIRVALFAFERELKFVDECRGTPRAEHERTLGGRPGSAWRTASTATRTGRGRGVPRRSGRWRDPGASSFRQGSRPRLLGVRPGRRCANASLPAPRSRHRARNTTPSPPSSRSPAASRPSSSAIPPSDWRDDIRRGLGVIASRVPRRSAASRAAYARARAGCRPPKLAPVDRRRRSVERVATTRKGARRFKVQPGEGRVARFEADSDQLDQLLINLVRNAADAVLSVQDGRPPSGSARVSIRWTSELLPGKSRSARPG